MSESPELRRLEERISEKIKELSSDFKTHCTKSEAKMHEMESDIIENNVLLEQFVDMQQKQTDVNERLNNTLITLNGSISTMEKSIKELFTRTEKTEVQVHELDKKTLVMPELIQKIEENEQKHKIDLRDVDREASKEVVKKNWKMPVAVGAASVGGVTLIALVYKAIELAQQIIAKLPQ